MEKRNLNGLNSVWPIALWATRARTLYAFSPVTATTGMHGFNSTWKESFATLGRFDVIDIVEADHPEEIEKAAMIIRGYGHSTTETLQGTPWKVFLEKL